MLYFECVDVRPFFLHTHNPAGDVFSWGSNSHGQLGLGRDVPLQPFPALVPSLTGIPVTLMAAGGTHSLFIALSGLVYCCGANKLGQLGLNRVDEKGTHQHLFRNVTLQMSLLLPMSDYLSLLFLLTQLFVLFEYNY